MKTKRRPKQNFTINYDAIRESDLGIKEASILEAILRFHKANCKFEFKNLLNDDLCRGSGLSENTMLKYRKVLEKDKYFTIKTIRKGKANLNEYRPNWSKLNKLNFIKPIEKSEYAPEFKPKKRKPKPLFEEGTIMTLENCQKLDDNGYYDFKFRKRFPYPPRKWGGYGDCTRKGKDVKKAIFIEEQSKKRDKDGLCNSEYKFIGIHEEKKYTLRP